MVTHSTTAPRPLPASAFNEYLAFFLLLMNFGITALLNEPAAASAIGVLGAMTVSIIASIVYRPLPISERARMRFLVLWALGLMLLVMTGRAHSANLLSVMPSLVFLSCIPLLVIGVSAPVRGFAWFVFPGFGLWMFMINLLQLSLNAEGAAGVWILLSAVAINLLASAYLGISSGPLLRGVGRSLTRASIGVKMVLPSVLVAFLASASVVSVRHALGPIEFPSLPGLPAISTSSEPVLTATFRDEAPENPYWEIPNYYVFPQGEHSWLTLDHVYEGVMGGSGTFISDPLELTEAPELLTYQEKVSAVIAPLGKGEQEAYEYARRYEGSLRKNPILLSLEGNFKNDFTHDPGWMRAAGLHPNSSGSFFISKAYKDFKRPRYGWNPYENSDIAHAIDRVFLSLPGDLAPHLPATNSHAYLEEAAPKTVALVRKLREGATDEEFIERVLAHFESNLAYHFDHQSTNPEENRLDYFLFEDQKGVCRHFANAFGMMMRLGGVPTRLVGGYAGGDFDPSTNTWTVRARDAHIWNHVWLEGKGWVRFDPTSVVPVEKGVPESPTSSLFGKKGRQKDRAPRAAHPFSTQGAPEQEGGRELGLGLPSLSPAFLFVILLLLAGLALFTTRLRPGTVPPEDKAWKWAVRRLKKSGIEIGLSMGPATVASQVEKALPRNHPAAVRWKHAAEAFEEWKYGGKPGAGLPAELRNATKDVVRALPRREKG